MVCCWGDILGGYFGQKVIQELIEANFRSLWRITTALGRFFFGTFGFDLVPDSVAGLITASLPSVDVCSPVCLINVTNPQPGKRLWTELYYLRTCISNTLIQSITPVYLLFDRLCSIVCAFPSRQILRAGARARACGVSRDLLLFSCRENNKQKTKHAQRRNQKRKAATKLEDGETKDQPSNTVSTVLEDNKQTSYR